VRRGDVRGRLTRLEDLAAEQRGLGTGGAKGRLTEDFFRRSLDALAHIRRAPIDAERCRYAPERLRGEAPVTVAAYVAALASLRHPDEGGAREILAGLADEGDADTLFGLVGAFGRFADDRTDPGDGGGRGGT
jgi:hypothetical protein